MVKLTVFSLVISLLVEAACSAQSVWAADGSSVGASGSQTSPAVNGPSSTGKNGEISERRLEFNYDQERDAQVAAALARLKALNHQVQVKRTKNGVTIIDRTSKQSMSMTSQFPGRRAADIDALVAMTEIYPQSCVAMNQLAFGYESLKQWTKARQTFEKFVAMEGKYGDSYDVGDPPTVAEKVAFNKRLQAISLGKRGYYECMEGNYKKAVEDLTAAIALVPNYLTNYSNRAQAYEKLNRNAEAEKDRATMRELTQSKKFVINLQREPEYTIMVYDVAIMRQRCFERGIARLSGLLAKYPNNCSIFHFRSILETQMGDYKAALADLDRILKVKPHVEKYRKERAHLADLLKTGAPPYGSLQGIDPTRGYDVGTTSKPEKLSVAELAKRHTGDVRVYESIIATLVRENDDSKTGLSRPEKLTLARKELAKYMKVVPLVGRVGVSLRYADIETDAQKIQDATTYLADSATARYELTVLAYVSRAGAYKNLKEYAKAISDYTVLLKLEKNSPEFYRDRADCYLAMKRYKQAVADYTSAIANNPEKEKSNYAQRAKAYDGLGDAALSRKDLAVAATLEAKKH